MAYFGRRQYLWLADVMNAALERARTHPSGGPAAVSTVKDFAIETLADALAADFPGFDRQTFVTNCLSKKEDVK